MMLKMIRVILMLMTSAFILIGCGGGSNASRDSTVIEVNPIKNRRSAGEDFRRRDNRSFNNSFADETAYSYENLKDDDDSEEESSYSSSGNSKGVNWAALGIAASPLLLKTFGGTLEDLKDQVQESFHSENEPSDEAANKIQEFETPPTKEVLIVQPDGSLEKLSPPPIEPEVLCQNYPKDEFGSDVQAILEVNNPK